MRVCYQRKEIQNTSIDYARDFETAHRVNKALSKYGDLAADGRPSLHLQLHELFKIILNIPGFIFYVPAHVWTPWCSSLSAMEGHNSLQDCFCPVCGKQLTIGVAHRVEQLANRNSVKAEEIVQLKYVLPLAEIFAEILSIKADTPLHTKSVGDIYTKAISRFGNEFGILHIICR